MQNPDPLEVVGVGAVPRRVSADLVGDLLAERHMTAVVAREVNVARRHVRHAQEVGAKAFRRRTDRHLDVREARLLMERGRRGASEPDDRRSDDEPRHERNHQLHEREASA